LPISSDAERGLGAGARRGAGLRDLVEELAVAAL
jgi:hypothetical protein